MKKLVGIIAVLTMLFSVASAATVEWNGSEPGYDEASGQIVALYTGLTSGQATMLAYDVTGIENATALTAFVDTEVTPIMGIDQGTPDGTFSFPIPENYTGKIVLMVGGTGVDDPISALIEIGGGNVDALTIIWGDINGDDVVDSRDGTAIINSTIGGEKVYGDYTIGEVFIGELIWGDINGNGVVDSRDGTAIINSTIGGEKVYGGYTIGATVEIPIQ